jgi:hypothetical protein
MIVVLLDLVSGAKTPTQPNLPKVYRIYLPPYKPFVRQE